MEWALSTWLDRLTSNSLLLLYITGLILNQNTEGTNTKQTNKKNLRLNKLSDPIKLSAPTKAIWDDFLLRHDCAVVISLVWFQYTEIIL